MRKAAGEVGGLAAEIGKRRPFDVPEEEAFLNLARTLDALAGAFEQLFRAHGLTDSQYNVLRILRGAAGGRPGLGAGGGPGLGGAGRPGSGSGAAAEAERPGRAPQAGRKAEGEAAVAGGVAGLPCTEIGERMVSRDPDVTRLVDRLEKAGLVERVRIARDRRVILVRITAAGLKVVSELDRPVVELHRRQLGHLTRGELAELSRLLVKARGKAE